MRMQKEELNGLELLFYHMQFLLHINVNTQKEPVGYWLSIYYLHTHELQTKIRHHIYLPAVISFSLFLLKFYSEAEKSGDSVSY